MTVQYGKGDKGKATKLHSRIVRHRAKRCERCGSKDNLQCAHIISRTFSATRCELENALCLCASCHKWTELFPVSFARLVDKHIGADVYAGLEKKAIDGRGRKHDWTSTFRALVVVAEREGVDLTGLMPKAYFEG